MRAILKTALALAAPSAPPSRGMKADSERLDAPRNQHKTHPMQASFTSALESGRASFAIGRVKAVGPWRAADERADAADRRSVMMALVREMKGQGAHALIDVRFEADETTEIDGVSLRRLVAAGSVVRAALAA